MSDIKTLSVQFGAYTVAVSLGFYYTGWALVLAQQPDYESPNPLHATAMTTRLSNNSPELPFPPPNPQNSRWRFCMKTYSENEGVLPQLIAAGVLQTTSRDLQGGPLVEVLLEPTQIAYCCLQCVNNDGAAGVNFEVPGEARLMRCSQCRIARYCNVECQKKDWKVHKKLCAVWKDDIAEAMRVTENTRRAELSSYINERGFQTINI